MSLLSQSTWGHFGMKKQQEDDVLIAAVTACYNAISVSWPLLVPRTQTKKLKNVLSDTLTFPPSLNCFQVFSGPGWPGGQQTLKLCRLGK